nr:YitT family protein [uncultured Carboxylicivirga sp.]
MNRATLISELKSYLIITAGLLVSAIGWTGFIIPSNIVGGGIMGLSSLIYFLTDLPVGPTNLILNSVLIIIAMRVLGKGFGFKTIYSLIMLSVFLTIFQYIITEPIVKEKFMAAIIGGGLIGFSIGILFIQGGSTGGTEIIALLINRKRNVSPGRVMISCDLIVISSSYIIFQSLETMVYGFVVIGLMSYVADWVLTGARQSVQITIISSKPDEVAHGIATQINRGLSFVKGHGYYSKRDRDFIVMVVRKSESHLIFQTIKEVDPEAFVTVANVMAVYGKGFDSYKPPISGGKRKKPTTTDQSE